MLRQIINNVHYRLKQYIIMIIRSGNKRSLCWLLYANRKTLSDESNILYEVESNNFYEDT